MVEFDVHWPRTTFMYYRRQTISCSICKSICFKLLVTVPSRQQLEVQQQAVPRVDQK
jgi:hypothetical protein